MVFTESDAENDGLIKREVGREMARVAQSQNPQLYEYFIQVCEEIGREPQDILGEMAVRALDSEEYANRIFESEVNMRELQADQIRVEDVEYVQQLTEKLGINEQEQQSDPIDDLIQQRLQSVSSSPLGQFNKANAVKGDAAGQAMEYMEKMEKRMERMEQRMASDGQVESQPVQESTSQQKESVDDLFGDTGGEDEVVEQEPEPERPDTQQISDVEVEDTNTDEVVEEEQPSQEEIAEAMDGVVNDPEEETVESEEDDGMDIDIPSETSDGIDGLFSSEDGEEE